MTDEQIIKALECVSGKIMYCRNCPYTARYTMSKCREQCAKDALDLINRRQQEIRQLHIKLDDYERDIVPKLKYSLERANKYGSETDAENIRLLKENENLISDLTSAKAEIERLKGNAPKIFISDKTPSRYFKAKSSQPILIYPYEETKIELVPSKEQIEAEAIKDFAKRLKAMSEYGSINVSPRQIDNIVKEMIGEQE